MCNCLRKKNGAFLWFCVRALVLRCRILQLLNLLSVLQLRTAPNYITRTFVHGQILKFCSLVKALQNKKANLWLIKPKRHGAMEVCLQEGSLRTYRDEDMGGYLASSAKLKGGSHNPRSLATSVLQRWKAKGLPHLKPS